MVRKRVRAYEAGPSDVAAVFEHSEMDVEMDVAGMEKSSFWE